ncbi:hypothetical protein QFZ71_000157 [Streptomyces sp. V2I9]|nr:hypothetical protein [Streptomyces sp. V2I9]
MPFSRTAATAEAPDPHGPATPRAGAPGRDTEPRSAATGGTPVRPRTRMAYAMEQAQSEERGPNGPIGGPCNDSL